MQVTYIQVPVTCMTRKAAYGVVLSPAPVPVGDFRSEEVGPHVCTFGMEVSGWRDRGVVAMGKKLLLYLLGGIRFQSCLIAAHLAGNMISG